MSIMKLISARADESGKSLYINTNHIVTMADAGDLGTVILTSPGNKYLVRESMEDISNGFPEKTAPKRRCS